MADGETKPTKVKSWFGLAARDPRWSSDGLAIGKLTDQEKQYVAATIDSLTTVLDYIRNNAAQNTYSKSGTKLPFLNPQTGQPRFYTPYFGRREDVPDQSQYFFNTDVVALLAWLDSLSNKDSIYKNPSEVDRLLAKVFPDKSAEGVVFEPALYITIGELSKLQGQVQAAIADQTKPTVEKVEEKTEAQAKEEEQKQASGASVPSAGVRSTQAEAVAEAAGEAAPTEAPTPAQSTTQPLVTPAERERRRMMAYESAWLTSAILHDLCGQHGITPTPELLTALRAQVDRTIGGYSQEQFSAMFANPSQRVAALRQLQQNLVGDVSATGFQMAYHQLVDNHLQTLRRQGTDTKQIQEFINKTGYQPSPSTELPSQLSGTSSQELKFTITDEAAADQMAEAALQQVVGALSGVQPLTAEQQKNLELALSQLALGLGDSELTPTGQAAEGTTDIQVYLQSLDAVGLYQLIYGNKKASPEALTYIAAHRTEIQAGLLDTCRLTIANKGAELGINLVDGYSNKITTRLDGVLPPDRDALHHVGVGVAMTAALPSRAGEVAALAANTEQSTAANEAYKQFVKQFQATFNNLDEQTQKLLIASVGIDPLSLRGLDGSYKFNTQLMMAAEKLPLILRDAKKVREAQDKIIKLSLESQLNERQAAEVQRLIKQIDRIGLHAEALALSKEIEQRYLSAVINELNEDERLVFENVRESYLQKKQAEAPVIEFAPEDGETLEVHSNASDLDIDSDYPEIIDQYNSAVLAQTGGRGATGKALRPINHEVQNKLKKQLFDQFAKKAAKEGVEKAAGAALTAATGGAAAPVVVGLKLLTDKRTRKPLIYAIIGGGAATIAAFLGKFGAAAGGFLGGLGVGSLGAVTGAIIGSVVPGVGTALGAAIGAGIGGSAGAIGGYLNGGGSIFGNGGGGGSGLFGGGSTAFPTASTYAPATTPAGAGVIPTGTPTPGGFGPSPTVGSGISPAGSAPMGQTVAPSSFTTTAPTAGGVKTLNSLAPQPSSQPTGLVTDPTTGFRMDPTTGQVFDPMGNPVNMTGASVTSAGVTAAAGLGAYFGFAAAGIFMPAVSVVTVVFLTLLTIITIVAAFLVPLPTGTGFLSNSQATANRYLELLKEASPSSVPNSPSASNPVAVTYTLTISPKSGYQIQLIEEPGSPAITDVMYSLPDPIPSNDPAARKAVWSPLWNDSPGLTIDSFPSPITSATPAQYTVTFTAGTNALVMNEITIRYNVLSPSGEVVASNEEWSTTASFIIGNPKVLCWPTTGSITQLPFDPSYSHTTMNAYDIANRTKPDVYSPFTGTATKHNIIRIGLGYGNYVRLTFSFGPYQNKVLIFGHLDSFDSVFNNATGPIPIQMGQRLGRMGSSGFSSGTHLHYELVGGKANDFAPLLPPKPGGGTYAEGDYVRTCYPFPNPSETESQLTPTSTEPQP